MFLKYVVFGDRSVDFDGALITCRNYGMQLATITSQADTIDVLLAMSSQGSLTGAGYWIGATNFGRPNLFVWVLSNMPIWYPIGYQNWAAGEPNNAGGTENCVEVFNNIGVTWNDVDCGRKRGVVCQV
ncbi:hypothetical protein pipiens_013131 [Culex pipiens pipiens]|uniref:C-type lectin domain-containing protein n=1 Tax=Culex pipiens pipiens TaxID=38569 RepID=A0ABD1D2A7_CULPP